MLYLLPCIVKHITNQVTLQSLNHFGPMKPWHSGYCQKALFHCEKDEHIVLGPQGRNIEEKEKMLSILYLGLQIILDF